MRTFWMAAALVGLFVAVQAQADTVYVKDGQMVWGTEVIEEGDSVVVVRPSGKVTILKQDVEKIERTHISIPQYYSPPAVEPPKTAAPETSKGAEGKVQPPAPPSGGTTPPPPGIGEAPAPPAAADRPR